VTSDPAGGLTDTATGSPITVTGLVNGTSYTFTVEATNIDGDSGESDSSSPVIPATVPNAPTGLLVTGGNGEASVAFTPPVDVGPVLGDGGHPITSYTAISSPGGFTTTGPTSPLIVAGLANGTAYTFTAHATNDVGDSVESDPSSSITPITTVTAVSPAVGPIGGATPVTVTGAGFSGATTVTFDGVDAALVSVTNDTTLTATSPAQTLTGPVDVIVSGPGGSSAASASDVFTYTPQMTGLSAATGEADGGTAETVTGAGFTPDTVLQFGGVAVADTYVNGTTLTTTSPAGTGSIDVQASNDSVNYSPANPDDVFGYVPDTPTGVVATPGDGSVSVAFVAPAETGGTISDYIVTGFNGGQPAATGSGDTSPIVVSGLYLVARPDDRRSPTGSCELKLCRHQPDRGRIGRILDSWKKLSQSYESSRRLGQSRGIDGSGTHRSGSTGSSKVSRPSCRSRGPRAPGCSCQSTQVTQDRTPSSVFDSTTSRQSLTSSEAKYSNSRGVGRST
jgi:hypothetical protein